MAGELEFDLNAAVTEVGSGLGLEQVEEIDSLAEPSERKAVEPPKEEPVAEEVKKEEPPKEGEAAPEKAAPESVANAKTMPKTWKPEVAAHWDGLPDQVKDEILRREQNMFDGLNQYKQDAELGRTMGQVLQPYENIMRQYNVNVPQQIAGLMHSHATLAFGRPEEKVALVQRIIKDYQIDPSQLGIAAGEGAYVDPQVADLQAHIQRLESQLSGVVQSRNSELQSTLERQIETFASDPANKYFNEVMPEMTQLLRTGTAKNIAEAYQKAVYLNPAVREKVLAEEFTAREAKRLQEQKDKLAAAEKSSKPARVVSRQTPNSDTAARGSMDDTLRETLAQIQNRS